jgi:PhnB protein
MKFYNSVLGGELSMQTFADAFPDTREGLRDRVLHARLTHNALDLMASDTHPEHSRPFQAGNNVHLSIVGSDETALSGYFSKLAEDGTITMPLKKQFWGDVFGMLTDKFGNHWMVNISA